MSGKSENGAFGQEWEGWKPDWARGDASPHAQQERHSPTAPVPQRHAIVRRDGPRQEGPRRRISDARLWDSLSPAQQDAAHEIALAFESLGRGLGYAATDFERLPQARGGAAGALECMEHLLNAYLEWTKRCKLARISHSMVIDVVVFGFSCRALDRDCGARRGAARKNLAGGLDIYCRMKGWPCG